MRLLFDNRKVDPGLEHEWKDGRYRIMLVEVSGVGMDMSAPAQGLIDRSRRYAMGVCDVLARKTGYLLTAYARTCYGAMRYCIFLR